MYHKIGEHRFGKIRVEFSIDDDVFVLDMKSICGVDPYEELLKIIEKEYVEKIKNLKVGDEFTRECGCYLPVPPGMHKVHPVHIIDTE